AETGPGASGRHRSKRAESMIAGESDRTQSLQRKMWLVRLALPMVRALSHWRKSRCRMRALWGATPIVTLPLKARATSLLDFESRTVVFQTYVITKDFDYNFRFFANGAAKLGPWASDLADQLIFVWALLRFDIFHYFHDRGMMRPAGRFGIRQDELALLRRAGKSVYLFAYGADVRTREATMTLGRWNFCVDCAEPGRFCLCDDAPGLEMLAMQSSLATAAVGMGDMLTYVPASRHVDYWPIDTDTLKAAAPPRTDGPLRIAHAPNHMHFKGSHHLEAAIEKLRGEGHAIEYLKVQGVPNSEVLSMFAKADIVADQFLGGFYGYTALEGMALARPVLSYVRTAWLVEAHNECPVINVTPATIEETLRWCLANRDRLPAIGTQGRAYVERWHSVSAVARRLGRLYEATANLPDKSLDAIRRQRAVEELRVSGQRDSVNWNHPFCIGSDSSALALLGDERGPTRDEAVHNISEPPQRRWSLAGNDVELFDGWTSYDRTPWRHPWLSAERVADFSQFSRATIDKLKVALDEREDTTARRFAFVGNLANINWMRAGALKRQGLSIDVVLHPHDRSLMSQPFWEEFDGERTALGEDPFAHEAAKRSLTGVACPQAAQDWTALLSTDDDGVPSARDLLLAAEYMPFLPLLRSISAYDSLLVTQTFAFGPLAHTPFVVGPSGGDIWFDPARGDTIGRLGRMALDKAFAVLVSNPITLAHARRYGLRNCLYLPLSIDEERYRPGLEPEIRREWQARSGGEFFVLTSMRLDNTWKGAQVALEGFARFASKAPTARLVMLGWGSDENAAKQRLQELGVADKVLILPIVGKARLARYLRAADCLIEQFVLGYFGASALEAMASGLPVIMRLERAQYDALSHAGAPQVLDAASADAVAHHLARLYGDASFRHAAGEALRSWFMAAHAGRAVADDYRTVLSAAAAGLSVDWSQSPLAAPLSAEEQRYHDDQLNGAPRFPNYEI
ncbi:MAG: glycosyltransferase, partial [Hyphomicrobiaceae bacterium]